MRQRTRSARAPALGALAAALLLLAGCAGVRQVFSPPPEGAPSGREGWLVYDVKGLRFEAPAAWRTSGDPDHVIFQAPDANAKLEVSTVGKPFPDQKACLAAAEDVLKRAESLERSRRHATRFGGTPAFHVEGDTAGWHVWAWAACDGGVQYQVFFTARTPATPDVLEALRTLTRSARIGGQA